jgi:two-component system response regulator DevR
LRDKREQGKVKRILLVEDHTAFREAMATYLERDSDFEVAAQADSLAEARAIASAEFDVAIIDIYLPDGNGLDLVRQLREEAPHIKTLVLTGSVDPNAEGLSREAGVDEVLFKSGPPSAISTSTRVAPASKAFSESSLTTEAGRSTTSPAATCCATRGSSTATLPKN